MDYGWAYHTLAYRVLLYSLALHPRVHSIFAGVPYCSSPWLAMEHGTNATELFALVGGDRYGPPAQAAPRASSNLPQPYILRYTRITADKPRHHSAALLTRKLCSLYATPPTSGLQRTCRGDVCPGDPRRRRQACASGRARHVGGLAAAESHDVAVGMGARASTTVLYRYTQAATALVRPPASRSDACAPHLVLRARHPKAPFTVSPGHFLYYYYSTGLGAGSLSEVSLSRQVRRGDVTWAGPLRARFITNGRLAACAMAVLR